MADQLVLRDCGILLDDRPILDSINLSLDSPGLHCLIGANGAGKTTLLRLICGLLEGPRGSVRFSDIELTGLSGRDRAALISYVPQIADDGIPLRVDEAVEVARLANPAGTMQAGTALEMLELQQLAHRKLNRLSGGELKRAMIAQALVQDTRVMLLDEPTAHLDPPARTHVMQLLRDIAHRQGKLVLTSLHYPDLAAQFADSVILLKDGRLLDHGDPGQMTTDLMLTELYGPGPAIFTEVLS